MAVLTIVRPGMLTTVQDLGRWGFQSRGVPVSGVLDWYSHRMANRMVGNDSARATLEVTLIGPHVRFDAETAFAVAGAEFRLTLDDAPIDMNRAVHARPGAILRFGERGRGARAYLALSGGIEVPPVLGSRSTHVLTAMGGHEGRALKAGDALQHGARSNGPHRITKNGNTGFDPLFTGGVRLRMIPVDDRLAAQLTPRRFVISPRSDRMGYRLEGPAIAAAPSGELISAAVPTGAIQVPPAGHPILLMNDHATTGGYAIAGTVIAADLPLAGQLAPGDWVEFGECSIDAAMAALREREDALGAA